MIILLISTDLMASSQLEGAARSVGGELVVAAPAKAIERAAEQSPVVAVLDLTAPMNIAELAAGLKKLTPTPVVVAFGPHVHEAKLQAAADAGCDEVLTRGQMHRSARDVLARYASGEAGAD